MHVTKKISLKTFALMAAHNKIKEWAKRSKLSDTAFILKLVIPNHLKLQLFVHHVSCEHHTNNSKLYNTLHLHKPNIEAFYEILQSHFHLPEYNHYDERFFFSKTLIIYCSLMFIIEQNGSWLENLIFTNKLKLHRLNNYILKSHYVKCIIEPGVQIRQPLYMKINFTDNELVCVQETHKLSSAHNQAIGIIQVIFPSN